MIVHACTRKFIPFRGHFGFKLPSLPAGIFFAHHHPLVLLLCERFDGMAASPPSLQALLGPIFELNRHLDSLLDLQWRLMTLEGSFENSHPELAELLRQSTVGVQRAIQRLRTEQSALMHVFLQTLQHYVREHGSWPDLDALHHRDA